jgi:hypothetical protein
MRCGGPRVAAQGGAATRTRNLDSISKYESMEINRNNGLEMNKTYLIHKI